MGNRWLLRSIVANDTLDGFAVRNLEADQGRAQPLFGLQAFPRLWVDLDIDRVLGLAAEIDLGYLNDAHA